MRARIKLKDLVSCISIKHRLRVIDESDGYLNYPSYGDLRKYDDYYVLQIEAFDELSLSIYISEELKGE